MNPRKLFTFIIAGAIFIGRSIKGDTTIGPPLQRAKDAITDGGVFFDEAKRQGIAPTEEELG